MRYEDDAENEARPTAASLRAGATAMALKLAAAGEELQPILPSKSGALASSVWGRAWGANLQQYSFYAQRLPQGRTCLKQGCVLDLQLTAGKIEAKVFDGRLQHASVRVQPLDDERWKELRERCAGHVDSLLDLLQGKIAAQVMAHMTEPERGLFPAPQEIRCLCTCTDSADLCRHAAAALYAVGLRLDHEPAQLFTLRSRRCEDLLALEAALAPSEAGPASAAPLENLDLAALFDLELD